MKSPQRNLFLAAIAALTATLSSSVVAQDTTATLPEDFPVSDYTLVEGNSYTSPTFGAWEVDTTVENRIVHAVLGPLTWANDTETDLVTLSTERWGALYTTFGTFEAAEDRPVTTAGLAIQNFPVVLSELDSGYYSIDNSGENPTPFFNHTKLDEEEGPIGAQAFIVYQINDFEGYFAGLVGKQSDMQSVLDGMYEMLAKLQSQNAYIGNSHIEEYYGNLVTDFETLHATYEDFVFFYHRLALTPYWVEAMGGTEENVASAQLYVNQLPLLEQAVLDIYKAAQVIRFENAEFLRTQLLGIISELEKAAAANPPSSGGSGGSSGGGGYVPPSTGGGSTTPIVVDGDAINWADVDQVGTTANQGIEGFNVSAQLNGVNPHIGNYYGPTGWYLGLSISGTQNWQSYDPYGTGGLITGNIWIFVPQGNGRYWAAVFEGYGNFAVNFPAGNLNFEHHNILAGTPIASPWTPTSGVQYGWMVSTNLIYPGRNGDQRSNIIIQAWP